MKQFKPSLSLCAKPTIVNACLTLLLNPSHLFHFMLDHYGPVSSFLGSVEDKLKQDNACAANQE